jgi:CTP:molybdopterin cytidylyltransferase MocA
VLEPRDQAGPRLRLAVVILAAGAGTRFASAPGAKLLADLDGRPLLAHVLDAVRAYGPDETIVVLGHGADAIEDSIEATIGWAGETRVRNPAPDQGMASSLRLGIDALRASAHELDGAFIVLGDQPLLRTEVLRTLAVAAAAGRPRETHFVVPLYGDRDLPRHAGGDRDLPRQDGGDRDLPRRDSSHRDLPRRDGADPGQPRNPVLILRPGWSSVDDLEGDRGLAGTIAARPDQVLEVQVGGDMPDVDDPADLEALRSGE